MNTKYIRYATAIACMTFSTLSCFGAIIVNGVGQATVKPDSFAIQFETRATGDSVVDALKKLSAKDKETVDKLTLMDPSVKVRVLSEQIENSNRFDSREEPTFTCIRSSTVELRIGQVTPESVISALSEAKASFGRGYRDVMVTYGIRNYSEALTAALDEALEDASSKAKIIAKKSNLTLGAIKGIECLDGSNPCGGYSDGEARGEFKYSGNSPDIITVRTVKRVTFE